MLLQQICKSVVSVSYQLAGQTLNTATGLVKNHDSSFELIDCNKKRAELGGSAIPRQPVARAKQASIVPWMRSKNQLNIRVRHCLTYQILS